MHSADVGMIGRCMCEERSHKLIRTGASIIAAEKTEILRFLAHNHPLTCHALHVNGVSSGGTDVRYVGFDEYPDLISLDMISVRCLHSPSISISSGESSRGESCPRATVSRENKMRTVNFSMISSWRFCLARYAIGSGVSTRGVHGLKWNGRTGGCPCDALRW